MKISIKSIKENAYYFFLGLYIIYTIVFGLTDFYTILNLSYSKYTSIISGIILVIGFLCMMLQRYTQREMLLIGGIVAAFFVSYLQTGDTSLLFALLFVITAKKVDFNKAVKTIFISTFTSTFMVVFSSITNIWLSSNNSTLAIWGFGQKNRVGALIFALVMQWFYIRREKLLAREKYIIVLIALLLEISIDSITPFMLLIIWLLLDFLFRGEQILLILKKFRFEFFPLWCVVISFIMIIGYLDNNQLIVELNRLVTGRIFLNAEYYRDYGISLIGQSITVYKPFDSTYIRMSVIQGVIPLGIIIYGYVRLLSELIKSRQKEMLVIVTVFLMQGFMESFPMSLVYNYSIIFLATVLYKDRNCKII